MTKRLRAMDRQIAFQELGKIFQSQAFSQNENRMAVELRHFSRKFNIPQKNIFIFQKKLLRPLFASRSKVKSDG